LRIAALFLTLLAMHIPMIASAAGSSAGPEQAIIIHFLYGSTDFSKLYALEDRLEETVARTRTGSLDGHEIAKDGRDGYLYLYGPDADALFNAIKSTLAETPFLKGAEVTKRYGQPDKKTRETRLRIG
jgi:hypothetical protein